MSMKDKSLIERIAGEDVKNHNIDYLLDEILVHPPEERDDALEVFEDHRWPEGWHAVSTPNQNIVAYFLDEGDACRWRLDLINRALNP